MLDIQTTYVGYVVTTAACALVMALLWIQNRRHFLGLDDFLASYLLHFSGVLLVSAFRGVASDLVSIVIGNGLIMLGGVFLFSGAEKFILGKSTPRVFNYALFVFFIAIHYYFTLIVPSLQMRNINISFGTIVIYVQCARLLLSKEDKKSKQALPRRLGIIFFAYCVFALLRILYNIIFPPANIFFEMGFFDMLILTASQGLFILLTFSLFLMINRQLLVDMEADMLKREQAEKGVRESEERLSAVIEGSQLGYSDWDIQSGVVHRNERWAGMLGYTLYEISASYAQWEDLMHPDDRERARQVLQNHLDGKTSTHRDEYRLRAKDGSYRWVLDQGRSIERDPDGRPRRLTATHTDITDRKNAEEALKEKEARLRTITENAPDIIVELDRNGDILYISRVLAGFDLKDVLGKNFCDWTPPEYHEVARRTLATVFETGTTSEFETLGAGANGESRWYVSRLSPVVIDNAIKRVILTSHDITERKYSENALRENEERYRLLFENAPIGILSVDRAGNVIEANASLLKILGSPSMEATKKINVMAFEPLVKAGVADAVQRCFESGAKFSAETPYVSHWGKLVYADYRVSPNRQKDGEILSVLILIEDITERKNTEQALRESEIKFRALFEQAAIGVAQIETSTGRFTVINQRYCDILGYNRDEMLASSFLEITHPDDLQADLNNLERLRRNEIREFSMEKRYFHKNGSLIWVSLTVSPLWQPGEPPDFHIAVVEDITARKQVEAALQESENIFSSFLENSPVYVFFKDKDIRTLRLSKNYEKMLGVPVSEIIGKTMDDLFPSDLAKSMVADDQRILNDGKRVEVMEELNGRIYETTKFPIFKDDVPDMLAGFTLDITERKQAEAALQKQYQYLFALQQTTLELISQLDLDTLLENIVKRAGDLVETESGFLDLVDFETNELKPYIGIGLLAESLDHTAQLGQGVAGTVWQTGKPLVVNDYDKWINRIETFSSNKLGAVIGVPLLSGKTVLGVLGLAYDVHSGKVFEKETTDILVQFARLVAIAIENSRLFSAEQQANEQLKKQLEENKELQATLHELSIRDSLTGAYNRRYMEEAIKQECARAEREEYPISIVILDLDHLKEINGKYGHVTGGDQALRMLGEHLKTMCRIGDVVCRYGGDEFLIILHNAPAEVARQRVEQWRLALTSTDIQYNDMKFNISFSAGIAAFPAHGKDIEDIMLAADYALYHAKEAGRNCVRMYGEK